MYKDDGAIKYLTVGYNPDGTPIIETRVKITAAGVNLQTDFEGNILKDANGNPISQDIHNIGRPDGMATVVDDQNRVLHWNETGKEWVASLPISTDIANPTYYPPRRQDLVLETILLNPDLNKVFSKDSDAVINYAGYSLNAEYNEVTDSSRAQLQPRNLNQIEIVLGPDGNPVFWITVKDGIVSESLSLRLLNPPDPKNISGRETMYLTGDPGVLIGQNDNAPHENFRELLKTFFLPKAGGWDGVLPVIALASENNYFERAGVAPFGSVPNIDSLFSQPGNDPGKLTGINPLYPDTPFNYWINQGMDVAKANSDQHQSQMNFDENGWIITPDFQKLLFALSFASK